MAPFSSILHSLGIRLRHYLDNWLIQGHSWEEVLQSLETVLSLCHELGIVVNFVPSFKASPSQQRVEKLLSMGDEFLSSRLQPTSTWQILRGTLSSLSHLVLGDRLRMRSLQLMLHRSWDSGRFHTRSLGRSLCPRSLMVAGSCLPTGGGFSGPSIPRPRLLVRCF